MTTYRGRRVTGYWRLGEGCMVHVVSDLGTRSQPLYEMGSAGGVLFPLPSDVAETMLWNLARAADPSPPGIDWARWLHNAGGGAAPFGFSRLDAFLLLMATLIGLLLIVHYAG